MYSEVPETRHLEHTEIVFNVRFLKRLATTFFLLFVDTSYDYEDRDEDSWSPWPSWRTPALLDSLIQISDWLKTYEIFKKYEANLQEHFLIIINVFEEVRLFIEEFIFEHVLNETAISLEMNVTTFLFIRFRQLFKEENENTSLKSIPYFMKSRYIGTDSRLSDIYEDLNSESLSSILNEKMQISSDKLNKTSVISGNRILKRTGLNLAKNNISQVSANDKYRKRIYSWNPDISLNGPRQYWKLTEAESSSFAKKWKMFFDVIEDSCSAIWNRYLTYYQVGDVTKPLQAIFDEIFNIIHCNQYIEHYGQMANELKRKDWLSVAKRSKDILRMFENKSYLNSTKE